MPDLKEGDKAPDFTLPTDGGGDITLSGLKGKNVVLYFYPKDDTPGCTTESCGFRDALPDFEGLNAQIIGLSKCSVKKHDKFKEKYKLNFPLASDENGSACEEYGAWVEKSMYGRKYMGIERSTFLIDEDGIIAKIWRKVKVPGHVEDVQKALAGLKQQSVA
ncbi:MAG: thioredoxin-dependent thiol peroxidase [Alphaproteobacteria bacterium]|nr:thioredoxin-dependent thiol peroxidase [Alphaproteobacteria bacterium]